MKTAICYYSRHHGNTRKVLEAMVRGNGVDLIDVTSRVAVYLEDYDCIGFASGIYYSKFQKSVLDFAGQYLPEGKDVFYSHYADGVFTSTAAVPTTMPPMVETD